MRILSLGFVEPAKKGERTSAPCPADLYRCSRREPVTFWLAYGGDLLHSATGRPP
jgi:hypothetical protein